MKIRLANVRNTGDPIWRVPIGIVNGQPVYPIGGGSPDSDAADDSSTDSSDDTDGDADSTSGDDGTSDDAADDDTSNETAALREELTKIRARMKAADRRSAQLQKELKQRDDAGKTDSDKVADELAETKELVATQAGKLKMASIRLQFFKDNNLQWYDVDDVLSAIESDPDLEYDDDSGTVENMKKLIAALAKRKPHWVKTSDTSGNGQSTGSQMNGKKKGESDGPDRAALLARYPALRR